MQYTILAIYHNNNEYNYNYPLAYSPRSQLFEWIIIIIYCSCYTYFFLNSPPNGTVSLTIETFFHLRIVCLYLSIPRWYLTIVFFKSQKLDKKVPILFILSWKQEPELRDVHLKLPLRMCEAVLMVWSCILDWSDRLCFGFSTFKWLLIVPSPSVSPIYPSFFVTPDGPLCGEESENVEFSLEMCAMEEGSEPKEVYCGSKAECTVGNLLPGTTYRFQVRASNSAGVSHPACMIQRFMHDLALYQYFIPKCHNINITYFSEGN